MANIEEKVEQLISDDISELGYDLYDLEYVKEGKDYFLRIYIDSPNGIGLEDCEKVSNHITEKLDVEDPIKEQYFLEISSPGIERILRKEKHLKDNIYNTVSIKLFSPLEKQKEYTGKLLKFDSEILKLEVDSKEIEIDRKNISQIKTVYNWEENIGEEESNESN